MPEQKVDWWGVFHRLMNELPWASPEALGQLTISQIMSLGHAKPPGGPTTTRSAGDLEAELARIDAAEAAEAAAWNYKRTG